LTDQDNAHLAAVGWRPPFGFGDHPVILSIDNYRSVLGDTPTELVEAVKTWPASTGLAGWRAIGHITTLLSAGRAAGIPVVHITGLQPMTSGVRSWGRGYGVAPPTSPEGQRLARSFEIVEEAAPEPGEAVLSKTAPSAFFGTPLIAHLRALGADTLIVCGESTSGCVRATVVDGRSYRFRVIVVEECVYDRHEAAHAMSLFDMHRKYADVLSLDDVVEWMRGSSAGAREVVSAVD